MFVPQDGSGDPHGSRLFRVTGRVVCITDSVVDVVFFRVSTVFFLCQNSRSPMNRRSS
jgi:hypothetical protein